MTNTKSPTWKFLTDDQTAVHDGEPTDSRGLRLRAQCGYSWVNMGNGWLQLNVAARKLAVAEQVAALVAAA